MAVKSYIIDPFKKYRARVTKEGAVLTQTANTVTVAPEPGTENQQRYFEGELGSTGIDSGSLSQNVDGSTTPQTFYLEANADYDIHIIQITAVVVDGAVSHSKFGAIAALTNGWDLVWTEAGENNYLIDSAKTTGQALVQSGIGTPFGSGNAFSIISAFSGNDDAVIISLPLGRFVPGGVRIGRGTTDRLKSVVNDNLTALTDFKVYVYGYKNLPQE